MQADIVSTNGLIHVIDTVLIPMVVAKAANLNLSKSNINKIKTNSTDTTKSIAVSDSGVVSRPAPIKPIKSK